MCIFLATNKTRHLSMSHQLIFSCKISVWSFLILTRFVCIVAHGGCRCCCYYLAPQTMHSVNVFCQPVDSLCNVTQSGLSFSLLVKFVYFVHILRVHLKVSLPQVRSHVCFSHAVWIRVYLSEVQGLGQDSHAAFQCPVVTTTCRKDWTAPFIKSLWHMPVYSCVWYVCVYDMYVTALVLRSKDNLQGLALSSTFWGLGTELRLFPLEASVCARWAISGS